MNTKKNLDDISAELEGLASILGILSQPYLEDTGVITAKTAGSALYGVSAFAKYISDAVEEIDELRLRKEATIT